MIRTVPATCALCGPDFASQPVAEGFDFEYRTVPDAFAVVRCLGCGLHLLHPRPADEELGRLYPPEYEPYNFQALPAPVRWGRELVQRRKVEALRRHLPPGPLRVVDVGCGGGALLRLLRRFGPRDWTLSGWDFPGPHLDQLQAEGFEVLRGPIVPEALAPGSVDVFVLNQVIEHFPLPGEVVAALAGQLRAGGVMFLETPDTRGWDAQLFRARYWGGYHFPRHLVLFHEQALLELLGRHGLRPLEVRSLPSPAFWVQSLRHALSERPLLKALAPLSSLRNPLLVAAATTVDLVRARFGPTSNLRVVARKEAA